MEKNTEDSKRSFQGALRQINRLEPDSSVNGFYSSTEKSDRVSLVIISLVEQLASAYESDYERQSLLAKSICQSLVQMQVINHSFVRAELTGLRANYSYAFLKLVSLARASLPSPSGGTSLPALLGPASVSGGARDLFRSRYKQEFEEEVLLGRGGFGAVYRASNRLDKVAYAVKKIHMLLSKQSLMLKILREVTLLARLTHPNIVSYKTAWIEPFQCNSNSEWSQSTSSPDSASSLSLDDISRLSNGATDEWSADTKEKPVFRNCVPSRATLEEVVGTPPSGLRTVLGRADSPEHLRSHEQSLFQRDSEDHSASVIFEGSWNGSDSDYVPSVSRLDQDIVVFNQNSRVRQATAILFIQMELCQSTLRQWLDEREHIDERDNFRIFRQLLLAVEYLHSQGILHRDIKPRNVFLNSSLAVKLGDFGLAKEELLREESDDPDTPVDLLKSATFIPMRRPEDSSGGVGTTAYAAPEQLVGSTRVDSKSDMYSLGVVMFELYTRPGTEMERVQGISGLREGRSGCLDPVEEGVGGTRVADMVQRLTRCLPEERPGAEELLAELFTEKDLCLLERSREQRALREQVNLQQRQLDKQAELLSEQEKELAVLRSLLARRGTQTES